MGGLSCGPKESVQTSFGGSNSCAASNSPTFDLEGRQSGHSGAKCLGGGEQSALSSCQEQDQTRLSPGRHFCRLNWSSQAKGERKLAQVGWSFRFDAASRPELACSPRLALLIGLSNRADYSPDEGDILLQSAETRPLLSALKCKCKLAPC